MILDPDLEVCGVARHEEDGRPVRDCDDGGGDPLRLLGEHFSIDEPRQRSEAKVVSEAVHDERRQREPTGSAWEL